MNWSFALGFVPWAALIGSYLTQTAVKHIVSVGPSGTYNDIPPNASTSDRWLLWLIAVVGAIVVEELLYRGAILSIVLEATRVPAIAIVSSSVAWGLAHGGIVGGYNVAEVSGIVASGIVAGWACYLMRSLVPGIAAHLFNNLISDADNVRPWTTVPAFIVTIAATAMLFIYIFLLARRPLHPRGRGTTTRAGAKPEA